MRSSLLIWAAAAAAVIGLGSPGAAQQSRWNLIQPNNTGIPGDDVRFAYFGPQGELWVSARDAFWGRGGVASFDGTRWATYSNYDTPMPSDRVDAVAFGSGGVRWFGTRAGLVRFDGASWTVFDSTNTPLPADEIDSVRLDDQGRVWVRYEKQGAAAEGVAMYDGTDWQVWTKQQIGFAPSIVLHGLAVDAAGDVWVGTEYSGGIARLRGGTWTIFDASSGHSNAPARLLTLGRDGLLWALWVGVVKYDGTNWIPQPTSPVAGRVSVSALEPMADGTYWVGTYTGLVAHYDGSAWTTHTYGSHVYSIDFDDQGDVWVGGLAGVKHLVPGGWETFNNYNTGLSDYFVYGITHDHGGNAWFATSGGGVCSYDGAIWRGYNPSNGGSEPWPFATNKAEDVFTASDGDVWVALGPQGVGRWDGVNWTQYLRFTTVEHLTEDAAGRIWIGYFGGVAMFDGTSWQHHTPFGNFIWDIHGDRAGNVWVATPGGLAQFDGTSWTTHTTATTGLPTNVVRAVTVAPSGDLWVGTERGLARFDGAAWTVYNEGNSGVPADFITQLAVAPSGVLWVGAFDSSWPQHGGVARFDGSQWTTYRRSNSPLPHEQIEALAVGPGGEVWIGTASEGVAVISDPSYYAYGPSPLALTGNGTPRIGGSPFALLASGAPPSAPGAVLISAGRDNAALFGGVRLFVALSTSLPLAVGFDPSGEMSLPVRVPAGWAPVEIYAQAFGASGTRLLHSNGLRIALVR